MSKISTSICILPIIQFLHITEPKMYINFTPKPTLSPNMKFELLPVLYLKKNKTHISSISNCILYIFSIIKSYEQEK